MVDFASIANKKLADVERPPLPPIGHYSWAVIKLPELSESGDGRWEILNFPVRATAALDDVDPEELAAYGKVENIVQSHRFMFSKEDETEFKKTEYRLRKFLEDHLKCGDESMSLNEAINASLNAQFVAPIVHRQDKNDPELFHANLGSTAPLE